jgi:hypothetical protein
MTETGTALQQPQVRTIASNVYLILWGLSKVNGGLSQINDVRSWWDLVFAVDKARCDYLRESGTDDEPFGPLTTESVTHDGWRTSTLTLCEELDRQSAEADRRDNQHRSEAKSLREQAADAEDDGDDDEADALIAAAMKHETCARLAVRWQERAAHASTVGSGMVPTYDRKYAALNRAAAAAVGLAAEGREYAA